MVEKRSDVIAEKKIIEAESKSLIGLSTKEKLDLLRCGKTRAQDHVHEVLGLIAKNNKHINAILFINGDALAQARNIDHKRAAGKPLGKLAGLTVAVKSCISVQGLPITCASRTLENYSGTFDADAIARIKAEDGIIIGMANMDEFACGISGEHSAFGPTQNPAAPGHVPGGSSSGSAAAVAAGFCDLALGTDTGGSVRNPASHCNIVGIKPSYGRVSRYGLLDLSMSLDQISALSPDTYGAALLHSIIDGVSENDPTTIATPVGNYLDPPQGRIKIGVSDQFKELCVDERMWNAIMARVKEFCDKTKSTTASVNLKHVKLGIASYYPIVYTEFFSATRKLDGRKYAAKIEETCGAEVLRRITGGKLISRAEYDGQYYRKALAAKVAIGEDFADAFNHFDVIVAPVTPTLAHKLGENLSPQAEYAMDAFTIPANLAGICAGVVPCGKLDGVPFGIQIFAPAFNEEKLFSVLMQLEKLKKSV